MDRKLIPHHSHWGAFNAVVGDGRVVGAVPFEFDPDPSPLIDAIPDAVHSPVRIAQPMVREGWLRDGPASGSGRGREPFVPVGWERALDLVAGELARVRRDHGPEAVMGGSQGWSSAGHFHEARGQLRRFLAASGGFVDQTSNYSFGTALTFLPHILGNAAWDDLSDDIKYRIAGLKAIHTYRGTHDDHKATVLSPEALAQTPDPHTLFPGVRPPASSPELRSASAITPCGLPARAISTWRKRRPCRTPWWRPPPAPRRAGERN